MLALLFTSVTSLLLAGDDWAQRAAALYARGDLTSAIAELSAATRECPQSANYRFMLGNALYRAGKIAQAADTYERALRIDESHVEARMSAGFSRYESGDTTAAVKHFTRAVSDNPEMPFARAALAVALLEQGDISNALIQYNCAVLLDSRYGDPDALAIDIRWKPKSREVLERVKILSENKQE